jgi:hypothetical protein
MSTKSKRVTLKVTKNKKLKSHHVRIPRHKVSSFITGRRKLSGSSSAKLDIPVANKISLFFDLDATLVSSKDISKTLEDTGPTYSTTGPHRPFLINYKYDNKYTKKVEDIHTLIYTRPLLAELLTFLDTNAKHFNICVWTTGHYLYAREIVKGLGIKPYIFLARDDKEIRPEGFIEGRDPKYLEKAYTRVIYDVNTHKTYEPPNYLNGNLVKDMEFLFTHPDFKDKINRNRTILIDDLPSNILVNDSKNVIWVDEWSALAYCDDTLKKLRSWLEKHKNKQTFANVKMPNYSQMSTLNKLKSSADLDMLSKIERRCTANYKMPAKSSRRLATKSSRRASHFTKLHRLKRKILAQQSKTKKVK